MTYQIKMAYCYPETTRKVFLEDERGQTYPAIERIPGHPTRFAKASDFNTWWQDVEMDELRFAVKSDALIRIVTGTLIRN